MSTARADAGSIGRATGLTGTVALMLAALAAVLTQWWLGATTDVSWLLTVNERILGGEQLYVDVRETNPPFSVWLYRLPVLIAEATGVPAQVPLFALITIAGVSSFALATTILRRAGLLDNRETVVLGVAALVLFGPLAGYSYAQREYIGLMALMPWLALQMARLELGHEWRPARRMIVPAGLLCSVMVMVKPYWVLTVLAPVLLIAIRQRSIKPFFHTENLLGAGAFLAYVALAYWMHPYYFGPYLEVLMAVYVSAELYAAIFRFAAMVLILIALLAMAERVERWSAVAIVCIAAVAGYVVGLWLIGRAFPYYFYPPMILMFFAALDIYRRSPAKPAFALAVMAIAAIQLTMDVAHARIMGPDPAIARHLSAHHNGASVVAISTDLAHGHPMVRQSNGTWIAPAPNLWATVLGTFSLPGAENDPGRRATIMAAIEDEHRLLAETIVRERPDVVLISIPLARKMPHIVASVWNRDVDGLAPSELYKLSAEVDEIRFYVPIEPGPVELTPKK